MSSVLLSVGDASGDRIAADFVEALRARRPELRFVGMGGDCMERAGVELVVHQREVAVGGLVELLPELPRIVRAWRHMLRALRREEPALVVLIDSSGFNLPFARRVRRQGVPALYYVAPQVWAWRRRRIRKLARRVSRIAVILPFESEVYAGAPVRVDYVGHPLLDALARMRLSRDTSRKELSLADSDRVIALLPGSRRGELQHQLGLYLDVARRLHRRDAALRFVLPVASTLDAREVERGVAAAGLPAELSLALTRASGPTVLSAADVALAKPGTATLEAAVLGCPLVVAARAHPLTAAIARRLVRLPSLTLPNLIAGAAVVPELLQQDATAPAVADAIARLLEEPARSQQLESLADVARGLGDGQTSSQVARIAEEMLVERVAA